MHQNDIFTLIEHYGTLSRKEDPSPQDIAVGKAILALLAEQQNSLRLYKKLEDAAASFAQKEQQYQQKSVGVQALIQRITEERNDANEKLVEAEAEITALKAQISSENTRYDDLVEAVDNTDKSHTELIKSYLQDIHKLGTALANTEESRDFWKVEAETRFNEVEVLRQEIKVLQKQLDKYPYAPERDAIDM